MTETIIDILVHLRAKLPPSGITVHISKLRSTLIPFGIVELHKALPDVQPEAMSRALKELCEEGVVQTYDMDLMPVFVPADLITVEGFGVLSEKNINFANKY